MYSDNVGERWWTTAWFNGREKSEASVEIPRRMAIEFIHDRISKDDWLSRYFPKQMDCYYKAIEQTRQHLLGM